MNRRRAPEVAVEGCGGERPRYVLWRIQKSVRVLDAALCCQQGQFGVSVVLSLVCRQAQRLSIVDGIVENGRGGEGAVVVLLRSGHCAEAHMQSAGVVMSIRSASELRAYVQRRGTPTCKAGSARMCRQRTVVEAEVRYTVE